MKRKGTSSSVNMTKRWYYLIGTAQRKCKAYLVLIYYMLFASYFIKSRTLMVKIQMKIQH